jgi:NADH:ubiquinone oxidoreductase subunit 5 (subunit L)/multisubunit Na+/H+ antiporter MnhA subunit
MPELASTGLVLAVVAAGFTLAYARYGTTAALRDAVARLRNETLRTPPVLVHAYYFDAAYELIFARSARALGSWFDRVIDPHVIDAGVREVAISSEWLGHLFRSFQTGLVRVYALSLVFGVACFVAYYALAFGVSR